MNEPVEEKAKKYCDATEALIFAKGEGIDITLATLLSWVEKHKLGFQPGGNNSKWFIDRKNFIEFLKSKKEI